ncbi:MAG: RnfABCDGE type electron transport complex subunit D [Bacteroidia bacterium]|nr:RnfABCDGE type electron transport complex subunit D [Bacteroidia bacterium]
MERILTLANNNMFNPRLILQKDGRHPQILYLTTFLIYGIIALGWEIEITRYIITIVTCLICQAVGIHFTTKKYNGLKSALITALSLCLMFKANLIITIILAAVLSIGSKYFIRINNKHIFNPSNFGIIATILLTNDAWVSPGQWGSDALQLFYLGIAGFFVLFRVGRINTSLSFLATFIGLQFTRQVIYMGWPVDHFFHSLTSGTLLLFTFFMITDPVTTPNAPKARIIWAGTIGVLAFLLTNWFYVHTAPLWALFIISPLTVLLNKIFIHKKFSWS